MKERTEQAISVETLLLEFNRIYEALEKTGQSIIKYLLVSLWVVPWENAQGRRLPSGIRAVPISLSAK